MVGKCAQGAGGAEQSQRVDSAPDRTSVAEPCQEEAVPGHMSRSTLTAALRGSHYQHPHFNDEDVNGQRAEVIARKQAGRAELSAYLGPEAALEHECQGRADTVVASRVGESAVLSLPTTSTTQRSRVTTLVCALPSGLKQQSLVTWLPAVTQPQHLCRVLSHSLSRCLHAFV